jgi:chromosome segregation ATPase
LGNVNVMHEQGTVSRKGSMTGGWTGSSGSYAKTYWTNKQRHDKTLHQLHACRQQLSDAEAEGLSLQQQRAAAEAQLASAQQRQQLLQEVQEARAEAAAAAASVAQEQQQLGELQGHCADLQQRLQQYRTALGQDCTADAGGETEAAADGNRQTGKGIRGRGNAGMGGKVAAVVLQQQLQVQVEKAQAAMKAAEQQLEGEQAQVST